MSDQIEMVILFVGLAAIGFYRLKGKAMGTPKWARGMKQLKPGVYVDGQGDMHFHLETILEINGYPNTAANQLMLEIALRKATARNGMKITQIRDEQKG